MIRYLLKFVSKLEYAQMLVDGKLFMRPASYYRRLEMGQGDMGEGAVFRTPVFISIHSALFIVYML